MRSSSSGSVHAHPGVWVLECKELGVVSQTSRLDRAEDEVVEAIAYPSGLAPSEFDVEVVPVLPDEIETLHVHAEQTNKKAVAATREAGPSPFNAGPGLHCPGNGAGIGRVLPTRSGTRGGIEPGSPETLVVEPAGLGKHTLAELAGGGDGGDAAGECQHDQRGEEGVPQKKGVHRRDNDH